MRPQTTFLFSGFLLFFIFVFYSYLVDINIFKQFDFNTTVRLQDNITRRFDDFFSWFSFLGMFEITFIVLISLIILKRKIFAGLVTFSLFGLFHIIELIGKSVVDNIPPPEFMLRTKRLIEFPMFHVRSEFSYPSGHSGRTVFLSVMLIIFIWKVKKLPIIIKYLIICLIIGFDLVMLVSRIYLGEHWFTDVLGGSMLGAAFAFFACSLYYASTLKLKKKITAPVINNKN